MCIEPNAVTCEIAKLNRNFGICALVTSSPRTFVYADIQEEEFNQYSGIIEFYSDAYKKILAECEAKGIVTKRRIATRALESMLKEYDMNSVSWISVDCEGCEADFITTFNFTKYDVQILNYKPNTAARMHTSEIESALATQTFVEVAGTFQDRVFYRAPTERNA